MYRVSARSPATRFVIVLFAATALLGPGDGRAIASTASQAPSAREIAPFLAGTTQALQVAPAAPAPAPAISITAIAAGANHTCALTTAGGVECWGLNSSGQLGDGSTTDSPVPVGVAGLSAGVKAIAAGGNLACAVLADGSVRCWGDNLHYGLGDGSGVETSDPVRVPGITTAVAVAVGLGHACALLADHSVRCWGTNERGQLGDRTRTFRGTSVAVAGISTAIAISAGEAHSCAVLADHSVGCWGANHVGQLGDGTKTDRPTPVRMYGISTAVGVSAGLFHTCALLSTGSVRCWGSTESGQGGIAPSLSDQGSGTRATPVYGISSATAIASGGWHNCALLDDGRTRCWGEGGDGQVGVGGPIGDSMGYPYMRPEGVVLGISTATAITAGERHSCALLADRTVRCWGRNTSGQLGDGSRAGTSTPVDVVGFTSVPNITLIAAGASHTCALTSVGGVKCWGRNNTGQLGNGTTANSPNPVDVVGLTSGVAAIGAGASSTCALTIGGGVKCWGHNYFGQLGNGTTTDSPVPVDVAGLVSGIRAISVADMHTCAVTSAGTALCWGYNQYGELGTGTPVGSRVSVPVASGPAGGVVTISAGAWHTCALSTAGAASCWGGNVPLGNGTTQQSSVPVDVAGLGSGVRAISAGTGQTCALTDAGGVLCWGDNRHGELGNGSTIWAATPVQVSGLASGVNAVTAGDGNTCAVTAAGFAMCWGDNQYGKLGDGTTIDRDIPVDVAGLGGVATAIAAGTWHSCALMAGGGVRCWGDNRSGQLGNGTTISRSVPGDVQLATPFTIGLGSSKTPGTIARGTTVTFTAAVRPLALPGTRTIVRFVIYRQDGGVWRIAARRDVAADANGRATLRWGFVTAGARYVRAKVMLSGRAWSMPVRYWVP